MVWDKFCIKFDNLGILPVILFSTTFCNINFRTRCFSLYFVEIFITIWIQNVVIHFSSFQTPHYVSELSNASLFEISQMIKLSLQRLHFSTFRRLYFLSQLSKVNCWIWSYLWLCRLEKTFYYFQNDIIDRNYSLIPVANWWRCPGHKSANLLRNIRLWVHCGMFFGVWWCLEWRKRVPLNKKETHRRLCVPPSLIWDPLTRPSILWTYRHRIFIAELSRYHFQITDNK